MYLPTITKHKPNNVYSLQIKSTTNKNIYIYSTSKTHAKIMYIEYIYSLEIKSITNKNIYIYH